MAFGDFKGVLGASAKSITNPFAATGSVAIATSDLIFATIVEQASLTAGAVTDNLHGSTTYTAFTGTDAGTTTYKSYYLVATVAGTLTSVNATATASSDNVSFQAAVFTGPFSPTASVLDVHPANATGANVSSPISFPDSGTLAQASEVIISALGIASNADLGNRTATAPATLTTNQNDASNVTSVQHLYQTVSTTASVTQQMTFDGTPSVTDHVKGTASFKAAPAAAAQPWTMGEFVYQPLIAQ